MVETPDDGALGPNPLFSDAGPLADQQERRVIFAAIDSFQ